jgi:threonine/homoserine/homoserine lactone efflux protein
VELYAMFVLVAAAAVASPGPGVVMTLTNGLRFGWRGAIGGILGIAAGVFAVASLSATGAGVILATSARAFSVLKLLGAAYLVFLGVRLWRAPAIRLDAADAHPATFGRRFAEGLSLQLTNPKALVFFLSVFPQFVDPARAGAGQFALLVTTYAALVVTIHSLYAVLAGRARGVFASETGSRVLQRAGGAAFVLFGAALATSRR